MITAGLVFFLHCGTPCNTFTSARKNDGGPPPLRFALEPMGLQELSEDNQALVLLGNIFLFRTVEACRLVFNLGGNFSIENPLLSLMWQTQAMQQLISETRALALDFDQCAFGAPSVKPTRLLCSTDLLDVCVRCPGNHFHVQLKVRDPRTGKLIFRTKAAQIYPWALCASIAMNVTVIYEDALAHLSTTFCLTTPVADRKRELGSSKPWPGHRQADTALKAQWDGYQLKRGAAKLLLDVELEPGQAVRAAMLAIHPFTVEAPLPDPAHQALQNLARPASVIVQERYQLLTYWEHRARALLPWSVALIRQQPDPALRRLLLGFDDGVEPVLGQVCHVELYAEMLSACKSVDKDLPVFLLHGFPIVGPIAPTGRWPPYTKPQKALSVQDALKWAWALRRKIISCAHGVPVSDNLRNNWEASIEDVTEGSCLGPFSEEAQVSKILDCEDWIPTQRFEVVQKNKVRGCDSATTNMINQITVITEKPQLPSTDSNVAALTEA